MRTMWVLLVVLLSLLMVSVGVLTGCASSAPSEEAVEEALFSYLNNDVTGITTDNPRRNVRGVDVVEIGEPFDQGRQTMWPVKVTILKSGDEQEQAEYVLFKDVFGDLKVLRRTAALPSSG